jgi:hypothetical protein
VNKLNDKTVRQNELQNYVHRLEATSSYINEALNKHRAQKIVVPLNTRMFR